MNTTAIKSSILDVFEIKSHDLKLLLLAGISIFAIVTYISKKKVTTPKLIPVESTAKLNKNRKLGHWIPDYEFQTLFLHLMKVGILIPQDHCLIEHLSISMLLIWGLEIWTLIIGSN